MQARLREVERTTYFAQSYNTFSYWKKEEESRKLSPYKITISLRASNFYDGTTRATRNDTRSDEIPTAKTCHIGFAWDVLIPLIIVSFEHDVVQRNINLANLKKKHEITAHAIIFLLKNTLAFFKFDNQEREIYAFLYFFKPIEINSFYIFFSL